MDKQYLGNLKLFHHPDRVNAYLKNEIVFPVSVKMYLTDRCNITCSYCIYADRISNRELSIEEAKKVIDKLKKMGVRSIVLTGGEPTLYKKLESFGKYAFDLGLDLGLITNGIIYPEIFKYLKWVRISLDTSNRNTYSKMKGSDGMESVLDNIE